MADVSATASARGGISFGGLLLIVLIVLKLNPGGYLDSPVQDWSWWLVIFGPLLLTLALTISVMLILALVFGAVVLVLFIIDKVRERKREKFIRERNTKRAGSNRFK